MSTPSAVARRLPVRIAGFDGSVLEATVDAAPAADGSLLLARLNDPDAPFLACEIEGRGELLHLAWIAWIETEAELPEPEFLARVGAARRKAELTLVSGETIEGELLFLAPPERRSAADGLSAHGVFALLRDEDRVRFVHRGAVTRVREL